ncbi:telomere-protecting terminal protein Tpg [Kitasatospora sp. NPDC058397]|uniref:telomere-protecting terminal protein Tpg n=1 Tax=unclassified Kitasatospora TaxID=2633591 RepID=UPI003658C9AD
MNDKIIDALTERFTIRTRDIAKTPQGRFNALAREATPKGGKPNTARLAERLGVSRRQVQRYLKREAKIGNASAETLRRLEAEVRKDHQPRIFAQAQQQAERGGLGVEARASFGFSTSQAGGTDDARLRRVDEEIPSHLIPEIFEAMRVGDEDRLRELVADGVAEAKFRVPGGGAAGLDVEFTDIDYIKFWTP